MLALLTLAGCLGPWDPEWSLTGDTGSRIVVVEDDVLSDTTWTSDTTWVLPAGEIRYVDDAELTIEPGTTILGEPGAVLIVTLQGDIDARGSAAAPIVFTSAQPVGSRRPGDWGGVILLGDAPLNTAGPRQIEGVEGDEPRARYGGTDDLADCGALEYVRIEYAGYEVFDGNELNGLTLGGCGRNTFIRHLQVHMGLDDGIEIFGGTVDLKWVVLTGIGDDSLDWDEGWQGRAQFLVVQQYPVHPDPSVTGSGDQGFEGDGTPSNPTITNVTMLGSNDPASSQSGLHLKEGTGGTLRNLLVGFQTGIAVDVEDASTSSMAQAGDLTVGHSMFFEAVYVPDEPDSDDGGFDELAWLQAPEQANRFGDDAGLPAPDVEPSWVTNPTVLWVPPLGSTAEQSGWTPPGEEFYDHATYVGAVRPGTTRAWWEGWVAFPYE